MTVHVTIHSMNRRLRSDHRTEHGAKQKPSDGLTSLGEVLKPKLESGYRGALFHAIESISRKLLSLDSMILWSELKALR